MDFDALQQVALRVAGERSLDGVLRQIVDRLIERPGVALARLWLLRPGDECGTCRRRDVCHNRSACLHLAASAGASLNGTAWSRVDGDFRRVPVGALKIGLIASRRVAC